MTDKELMQIALDALIDAADSQNWEMQQNIDQHGEWYRRSVYLKQSTTNSQAAIEALRARLSQCERCGEANPAEIHTCSPQEPVAWGVPNTRPTEKARFMMLLHSLDGCQYPEQLVPLYTTPPQREWQGLTDEDVWELAQKTPDFSETVAAIEAKLKAKNDR